MGSAAGEGSGCCSCCLMLLGTQQDERRGINLIGSGDQDSKTRYIKKGPVAKGSASSLGNMGTRVWQVRFYGPME